MKYGLSFRSLMILLFMVLVFSLEAAIPAGYYYFAKNKKKADLKTALKTYCAPLFEFDYGGGAGYTWQGFYYADNKGDNTVWDMYSNTIRNFNSFSAVSGMHIEHSLPKSWWGGTVNMAYKDLFHLYPADAITNTTKNNLPLGEVNGNVSLDNGVSKVGQNAYGSSYTGNCFEPADEYKGDFARSYLYVSTIYEDFAPLWQSPMMDNNTWPVWKPWAISLLLKWHHQDPVSAKELARIEAVYAIQGNRNPFIDYPDLADYIWGADSTKIFLFPEETQPFLALPRKGSKNQFGYTMKNSQRTEKLRVLAANLTQSLTIQNKNSTFVLSKTTLTPVESNQGIDLDITFAPASAGEFYDTLSISGGGLNSVLKIPLEGHATEDFMVLPPTDITLTGGTLNWIADPQATDYIVNVTDNIQEAGDLIIAAYVEGSSYNKAIEIYNGTKHSVDLSKYSLQKQSNGVGLFASTLRLSGTLAPGACYVIAHKSASAALQAKAALLDNTAVEFNGNDAVRLVYSGLPVDVVGIADDISGSFWGENMTLQRLSGVTHPAGNFDLSEWKKLPLDSIAFLGAHQMSFPGVTSGITLSAHTGGALSYNINTLIPGAQVVYNVESVRKDGNVKSLNVRLLKAASLQPPVVAQATDITSNSFVANWDESAFDLSYLLDVITFAGSGETTENEGFATVGSGGTPLPAGWTGTASGNYTSATSSGASIPSISLKNEGEWLQTKTYPSPVKKLTYMYRFASAASGSSLVVYARAKDAWSRIDSIPYAGTTSKAYPVYTFTADQNYNAFKFIYHKVSGNIAIDDVSATYGQQDSVYVFRNKQVGESSCLIDNLSPATMYYYRVRSALGSAVSGYSDLMSTATAVMTNAHPGVNAPDYRIVNGELVLKNLQVGELVGLYSMSGQCLIRRRANSSEMRLALSGKGLFVLQITGSKSRKIVKVLNS